MAAARLAGANVALISVAGEYAALEAHQALTCGLSAFVFSDHVAVADELALKRRGAAHGLLVMGPDCGTAMLGGVGLGFANVVLRGSVGIVAAAGTGAQEAACLLDAAGTGVSHILGVGGRDLSAEVGGIMAREALRRLAADDETETILLVSKPPAPEVVRRLADAIPRDKRVLGVFVGAAAPAAAGAPFDVHETIEAGALAAAGVPVASVAPVAALERAVDAGRERSAGRAVRGLFSGGSLAFPSVKEGFGLVALEALACELPVVASDLDVLRGFLTDGESALLTPCGDAEALTAALVRVATDPVLAARLRHGGRAVVARHGWDAAARLHERAYAEFGAHVPPTVRRRWPSASR